MLAEVFYWLLNMSIVGTLVGAVVWLVRWISRIPRYAVVWLWGLLYCRLCIPFGIGGRYGMMALLSEIFSKTITLYDNHVVSISVMNMVQGAERYFPISYKSFWIATVFRTASVVWISVASLLIVLLVGEYVQMCRVVRLATIDDRGVLTSPLVESPLVFGVFHPKIVVPCGLTINRYVILHEQAHIRRKDNAWRLIAIVLTVVHWFNPFAWLFLRCFLHDLELACDENVLVNCNEKERRDYAEALLDTAQSRLRIMSLFGGSPLRTRILRILSYQKLSVASSVACVCLVLSMAYVLLTNAL